MRTALAFLCGVIALSQIGCTSKSRTPDPLSDFHPPYPDLQIPTGGLSPNGQFAFVLRPGQFITSGGIASGHNPENYLLIRSDPGKYVYIPSVILHCNEGSPTSNFQDGNVRWAKDSSAVLAFQYQYRRKFDTESYPDGPSDIYVVPIINGRPGKLTDMLFEILKASHGDFVKAHSQAMEDASYHDASYQYGDITDEGLGDDLTFNDSNQIVIDCLCTNSLFGDQSYKGWTVHFTGIWDPIQGKFIKKRCTKVASPD